MARPATGAHAAASAGTWGNARAVPGTVALNKFGSARTTSVSCPSADNCTAVGFYFVAQGAKRLFVADERNGTWHTAIQAPGMSTLSPVGSASFNSLSCATPGNCAAGGSYVDGNHLSQSFVIDEKNGTWGNAEEVPGSGALNTGGQGLVRVVSCASPGDCAATGNFADAKAFETPFVVDEKNGKWGTAHRVPGLASLTTGSGSNILALSCASAGNCAAGGGYATGGPGQSQVFVVSETNGTWGAAQELPGIAGLNTGRIAGLTALSCSSAGNCGAGGDYRDSASAQQVFAATETNGTWGTTQQIPGTAALNTGGNASVGAMSCPVTGSCSAGGTYTGSGGQVFVVDETNGTWGTAQELPGIAALNTGGNAGLGTLSCAAPGQCAAGGSYALDSNHTQAYVVSETNGTWGAALEVPGTAALNKDKAARTNSVSCGAPGNCAAGGFYTDAFQGQQTFVANER